MARYYNAEVIHKEIAHFKEVLHKGSGSDFMDGALFVIGLLETSIRQIPTTDDVATKSDVVAEIIDDLAREGLLNVEPWAIAELKRKYREDINNEN
jgi:hypothetical protein